MEKNNTIRLMAVVIALYIGAMIVFSRPGLFYEAGHYYNIGDTSSISVNRADGDVETYRGLVFPSVDVGDRCEVHISLPKAYKFDHAALCFIVYHSVVRIYDGDKLIYSYGGMLERGGDMIGGVSDRIVIPDDAWGRGLTMELRVVENSAFSTVPRILVMDEIDSLRFYQMGHEAEAATLIAIICIFSLLFLLLVSQPEHSVVMKQGIWLSVFAVICAFWLLTYNSLIYVFMEHQRLISLIEYMAIFAMPVPFFMYLRYSEMAEKNIKRATILAMIFAGVFVVATVLNFTTRSYHYVALLPALHVIGLIAMFFTVDMLFRGHCAPMGQTDMPRRIGIIWLMASTLIEIVCYLISRFFGMDVDFLRLFGVTTGIVIFMLSLAVSYFYKLMNHVITRREKKQLENLAYCDSLTGLPNRAACFRDLEKLPMSQDYSLAFFDLNSLKKVNDLQGHAVGDTFIKIFADMLRDAFEANGGTCYRVGGDEFVGFVPHDGDLSVDGAVLQFEHQRMEYNKRSDRIDKMTASYGIVKNDPNKPQSFDVLLSKADDLMYVRKMAYKKAHFRDMEADRAFIRNDDDE
ncbi:MAG: GGDEF domain-containing protein [Schwartzia sp.]|nr:GGDEF domain-containing protein [Schwartzia sp. (in: firmicutes)]